MSLTIPTTMTVTVPSKTLVIHLPQSETVVSKLQTLFQKMRKSSSVSPTILNKIQACEIQFSQDYSIDFTSNKVDKLVREDAANDLCFFLHDVIHPVIASSYTNKAIQKEWEGFDDDIRKVLNIVMGEDPDAFIENYGDYYDELQAINDLHSDNQEKSNELYTFGNLMNECLMNQFDIREKLVQETSKALHSEAKKTHDKQDILTEKVCELSIELDSDSQKILKLTEKMKEEEETSNGNLDKLDLLAIKILKNG